MAPDSGFIARMQLPHSISKRPPLLGTALLDHDERPTHGVTVKLAELKPVPPAVVTPTGPVIAPSGTNPST